MAVQLTNSSIQIIIHTDSPAADLHTLQLGLAKAVSAVAKSEAFGDNAIHALGSLGRLIEEMLVSEFQIEQME